MSLRYDMKNHARQISDTAASQRGTMTNVQMSPLFKSHTVQKERPTPEGAGSSGCDPHAGPWTGSVPSAPGSPPLGHSLLRSKWSKDSLNGCHEYNSIRSMGTIRHTGHLCKKCVSYFNAFKGEALKRIIDGNLSTKDPKLPIHLYESMKTPASAAEAWRNVDGRCSVCSTHFSQLKQEAIRTILTQDRAIWSSSSTANISSTSLDSGSQTLPRTSSHRSAVSKPHQRPSNAEPESWIRGRQHLEAQRSVSSCNGIHSLPQKASLSQETVKESVTSTALCNFSSSHPSRASSMSSLLPAGTSAAVSFVVRAVQKLNVMVRRGRQCSEDGTSQHSTNFRGLLQKSAPPTPASIYQSVSRSKETPGMGKVKVMLRLCPVSGSDSSQTHSVRLDHRKKQITVLNVTTRSPYATSVGSAFSPKTFTFDAAFGHDSTQADVCESSLCELLQAVLSGADGCILSFGQTSAGVSYTMIGHDGCVQTLGVIPCAITWLFKLINRKKDKTWANISVSVTAVEVCGENNAIRDLLSDVDTGNCKDTYKPDAYLIEDPIYGTQLGNHSVLNAPTPESAASLLDAAIASRSSGRGGNGTQPHCCHMFFTLHVRQQHIGSSTKSGMNVDQSKLSLVTLGGCVGEKDKHDSGVCFADLGNIIIAKLNRHKHVPNKGSKLAMLLQDSLSNINCATTIIAHVSTSSQDLTESLCTMQITSRIRRLQKNARKSSSSSPGGGSSGNERKVQNSRLRTFQSTGTLDQDLSSPAFFGEPELRPGSAKSYDSVLSMDPSGFLNKEVTNRSREVLPVIPSLLKSKLESKKLSLMKFCEISPPLAYRMKQTTKEKTKEESEETLLQERSDFECLKCNTFAELQNRLGNIDIDKEGTRVIGMDLCKEQEVNTVTRAAHLSQAERKSVLAEIHASIKKESDSSRQGNSPKRSAVFQNGEETKNAVNSLVVQTCSPQLDVVRQNDPMQCHSRSKPQTEMTNVTPISLPLRLEDQSVLSYDSTIQPESRISPAGKSSPRSTSTSSFSSSLSTSSGSPHTTCASVSEDTPHCMLKSHREMRATITVTVQQPLDLNGQDELVYTVVEEVTINGANEKGKAKILSVHESPSLQTLASGSQPVRIIGSIGQEHTTSFLNSSTKEQTSDTEMGTVSSNVTLKENVSSQASKVNTVTDNASSINHLEDPPQPDTWSDVPLMEDVKDVTKGAKVEPSCNHLKHFDVSRSRQYNSDITMEKSWTCQHKNKDFKDVPHLPMNTYEDRSSYSPRETFERKQYVTKEWTKDSVPLPSTCNNSPSQRKKTEKREDCGISRSALPNQRKPMVAENRNTESPVEDSSKLFNAKLKALSNRSQTVDLCGPSLSLTGSLEGICTSPRLKSKQETSRIGMPAHSSSLDTAGFKEEFDNFVRCRASQSLGRVPRFFPMHDNDAFATTRPSKISRSKTTNSKSMPSSKVYKVSSNSPRNSIQNVSSKSLSHSINRSPSLSCNGSSSNPNLWLTQSLSQSQGNVGLSSKSSGLPLKGRIELLRNSRDSLSTSSHGGSDLDEREERMLTQPLPQSLPSPYSWITAPRKPNHCSGHASDTTSVLSGDLPPAMCKTALLYNRNSRVSSGYDSMLRDSEATISSSSTHNSISDQSCILSAAKGVRSTKKKNNIGSNPRIPSQDNLLSLKRSISGPRMHWGDRGVPDSYEIKVYEIDHVDAVQKRGGAGTKRLVRFSAKLKFLEYRQQRIAEVRSKYNILRRELEHAKQNMMVDPGKWSREFDLWQTFEVDSLEHLEALELVTERLERHVNLCKAHVLMVTCFDANPKHRQKCRHRPPVDHKGFVAI